MVDYSSVNTRPRGAEWHTAAGSFSSDIKAFNSSRKKKETAEVRSVNVTNAPQIPQVEEETKHAGKADSPARMNEAAAQRVAANLERALNDVHGTELKFRVVSKEEGVSTFNFAVIDTETGQVVREFPPDSVRKLVAGDKLQNGQGVFVDADA